MFTNLVFLYCAASFVHKIFDDMIDTDLSLQIAVFDDYESSNI